MGRAYALLYNVGRKELFILRLRHEVVKEPPKQSTNTPTNRRLTRQTEATMLHKGRSLKRLKKTVPSG